MTGRHRQAIEARRMSERSRVRRAQRLAKIILRGQGTRTEDDLPGSEGVYQMHPAHDQPVWLACSRCRQPFRTTGTYTECYWCWSGSNPTPAT